MQLVNEEASDKLHDDNEETIIKCESKQPQMDQKKLNKLSELKSGPVVKTLLKISIPSMIGFLSNALCNTVHSMIIGRHISDAALTGFSNFLPTQQLFYMNPMGSASQGCSTLISAAIGNGDLEGAAAIQAQIYFIGLIHTLAIPIILAPWLPTYLTILGVTAAILPYALQYGYISTIFQPLSFALNNLSPLLRCQNNAVVAMNRQLFNAAFNLLLAMFMVLVMDWGVRGTAASLAITNYISGGYLVYFLFSSKSLIPMTYKHLKPNWKVIGQIYYLGLSSFANQLPMGLQNLLQVILLRSFSTSEAQTQQLQLISGVCNRIIQLYNFPLNGLISGMQPLLGFSLGAKNYKRVYDILKKQYIIVTITALFLYLLIQIFAVQIVSCFTKTTELYGKAANLLRISISGVVLTQFLQISNIVLQQEGKATSSLVQQMVRAGVALLIQIFVPMITKNPEHMFIAAACGDFVGGVFGIIFTVHHFIKYNKLAKIK